MLRSSRPTSGCLCRICSRPRKSWLSPCLINWARKPSREGHFKLKPLRAAPNLIVALVWQMRQEIQRLRHLPDRFCRRRALVSATASTGLRQCRCHIRRSSVSSSDLALKRLTGTGTRCRACYGMAALGWAKEAVIEVKTFQTRIAILPPRCYVR